MMFGKKSRGLSDESRAVVAAATLSVLQKQIRLQSQLIRLAESGPGWDQTADNQDLDESYLEALAAREAS